MPSFFKCGRSARKKKALPAGDFSAPNFISLDREQAIEEETRSKYRPEEFFPVRIGEVYNSKYQVVGKLGFGTYSTVWLCRNLTDGKYAAMKVANFLPNAPSWTYRELKVYSHIRGVVSRHSGQKCLRELWDEFEVRGLYGSHQCLIMPPMHMSLYEVMQSTSEPIPIPLLQDILQRLLSALDFLHSKAGVVHCDIKAANIMLAVDKRLIFEDFEQAEIESPSSRKIVDENRVIYRSRRLGGPLGDMYGASVLCDLGEARIGKIQSPNSDVQPAAYRCPEVALGMSWGPPADIWNVGALTWYLVEGKRLFPRSSDQLAANNGLLHTAHLVAILGPPPEQFLARSDATSQYFDLNGNWVAAEKAKVPETTFEQQANRLQGEQKHLFVQFIRSMLSWLPEERKTAKELLDDPWLSSDAGI